MKPGKKNHLSEETKRKISAAKANHPMKGKHWSDEVKQKLRAANLGKKRSEETRHKISLGLKKKWRRHRYQILTIYNSSG